MKKITQHHRHAQRGVAAVEYALGIVVFFVFMFGTFEVARAMFVWNTMFEVTTRAARSAAMVNFNDTATLDARRKDAMFTDTLVLDSDIGYQDLKIDYLQSDGITPVSPMPPCPSMNVVNCIENPTGASCIRFVRVRLCKSGTNCTAMPYSPLTNLPMLDAFKINMPFFTAIAPVESLGMPGACS
jgi:hypothetical protein